MKPHPSVTHPYSPNVEAKIDPEAEFYWLQLVNFFQWPHVTYFDTITDLHEDADFKKIHSLMAVDSCGGLTKEKELLHTWCQAQDNIETGRRIPKNYSQAQQQLYGVTRLQVKYQD